MSLRILSAFCTLGSLVELNCAVGQFEGTGGGLDCAAAVDVWATEDAAKRRTETTRAALYMFECILPALPVCKHRVQLAVNGGHALQIAGMECTERLEDRLSAGDHFRWITKPAAAQCFFQKYLLTFRLSNRNILC